jgi:hypothetical protein
MDNPNSHPIARLIAAANISPTVFAIVAESIANEARHIRVFGDDPGGLIEKIARTLPPYDPEIHGVTRPGVWVGELAELTYEDLTEICGDAVIEIFEPLVEIWGEGYRCPSHREAMIVAENRRVLGSSSTSYGDLIVEVEIGTAEQLDRVIVPYQDPMLRGW